MGAWVNQYASGINTGNNLVFDKLNMFVTDAVEKATKERAETMCRTLKNRRFMGNQGQFPKGDGSKNSQPGREGEPHSHTAWVVGRGVRGKGWTIKNLHRSHYGEGQWAHYNYVRNLMFGTGWSGRVKGGTHTRLTPGDGDKLFSKQMPHGTKNWIESQRKHLINDVKIIGQLWKAGNL